MPLKLSWRNILNLVSIIYVFCSLISLTLAYDNQLDTIIDTAETRGFRRFVRKTVEKGQMGIHAQGPIEFLLNDPQGRRLGFDPITKAIVNEGLNEYYGAGDTPDATIIPPGRSLYVDVEEGDYSLQTFGTGTGSYTLSFSIGLPEIPEENLEEMHFNFTGVTQEGAIAEYPITITTSRETSKIEHSITIASMKQDVKILFELGWIDNQGVKNSLIKKIEAIRDAANKDKKDTARNILGALRNEVEAQRGKHIKEDGLKILLNDMDYLVKHL